MLQVQVSKVRNFSTFQKGSSQVGNNFGTFQPPHNFLVAHLIIDFCAGERGGGLPSRKPGQARHRAKQQVNSRHFSGIKWLLGDQAIVKRKHFHCCVPILGVVFLKSLRKKLSRSESLEKYFQGQLAACLRL